MKEVPIPEQKCPRCGYEMDTTSDVEGDHIPGEGDVTLCLNCGKILVFNADLSHREPTGEEMIKFNSDRKILAIQLAITQLKRKEET